jgi:hypothetical protein
MNRNELWLATCVLALALGVGIGQAQEKPAVAVPPPAPKVLYVPPVPPACPLLHELAGLEAIGCKMCVEVTEAKAKSCACCEASGTNTKCECCAKCAEAKKGTCAGAYSEDCCAPKKVKKRKKVSTQDFLMIAAPPSPPMPMIPPTAPITIYSPAPVPTCPAPVCMPAPAEPMMVFRACQHDSTSGCGSGVQQAKHEHGGKFEIDINLGFPRCTVPVAHASSSQLEIECGSQCKATCEHMMLHLPGGKQLTIATAGKQVVVTGPTLKATCDSLTRCGADGGLCLMLHGHVHLHHGKDGMKADIDSEQVRLVIHDGAVEVHTVTTP